MPTMKELHEIHLSHLQMKLNESELLLQKEGGLDGELKTSGTICEHFVRDTLQRYIVPGYFRVTSGFIATPELLRTKRNLPQCDIIIVRGDAVPLLRLEDSGIEVVPRESVCGIIEVKRTLTTDSATGKHGAMTHLAEIVKSLGETDTLKTDKMLNRANLNVGFHNHSSNKPLLGIISLQNNLIDLNKVADIVTDNDSLIDFIWSMDGYSLLPGFLDGDELLLYSHTARPETRTWKKLKYEDFNATSSEFYHVFRGRTIWNALSDQSGLNGAQVFSKVRGIVSLMLSRVYPKTIEEDQINDYYLRIEDY